MANYYVPGYTPPSGVGSRDQVRAMQQQMGVKPDGIWGPKTQAAYAQNQGGATTTRSYIPSEYKSILSEVQGMFPANTLQYNGLGRGEIEEGIRPGYDLAIEGRRKQTDTNKANIDVDAASRGMGASTWVTDVKNRQQDAEASDVTSLEAAYARELMAALQAENDRRLAVDQYNASAQAQALQNALSLSGSMYGQYLQTAQQQARGGGSRGRGRGATAPAVNDLNWLIATEGNILANDPVNGKRVQKNIQNGEYEVYGTGTGARIFDYATKNIKHPGYAGYE